MRVQGEESRARHWARRTVRVVPVILTGTAALAVIAAPAANAIGGHCNANVETLYHWGPDSYRVAAKSFGMDADTMMRGTLDVPQAFDKHTIWFTRINYTFRSGDAYAEGCTARCDMAQR